MRKSAAMRVATATSEVSFKIKSFIFFDTLILQIYFLIIKINIFRGDLSGISAKTATLTATNAQRPGPVQAPEYLRVTQLIIRHIM